MSINCRFLPLVKAILRYSVAWYEMSTRMLELPVLERYRKKAVRDNNDCHLNIILFSFGFNFFFYFSFINLNLNIKDPATMTKKKKEENKN